MKELAGLTRPIGLLIEYELSIFIGDFNMHFDKRKDQDANKLRDLLFSPNLDQHVQAPTYIHGHTLDLVITKSPEARVQDLQSRDPIMLDHTPLTFSLITKKPHQKENFSLFRN